MSRERSPTIPPRHSGWRHLVAATHYSFAGLRRLLRESAFRQELALSPLVLGAHLWLSAKPAILVLAVILLLMLFAFEALNTAIERIVDHLAPEWAQFAKEAKDLGSFAVFCLLSANGLLILFSAVSGLWPEGAAG